MQHGNRPNIPAIRPNQPTCDAHFALVSHAVAGGIVELQRSDSACTAGPGSPSPLTSPSCPELSRADSTTAKIMIFFIFIDLLPTSLVGILR
jgi:hypothetical protein